MYQSGMCGGYKSESVIWNGPKIQEGEREIETQRKRKDSQQRKMDIKKSRHIGPSLFSEMKIPIDQ